MEVTKSIDIENAVRLALLPTFPKCYVRPLPANFETPCLLVTQVGGSELNTIDTADIVIDARAELAEDASELCRSAVAGLKAAIKAGDTPIRYLTVNSTGSWGADPVRPDLQMYSARLRVTVHQEVYRRT